MLTEFVLLLGLLGVASEQDSLEQDGPVLLLTSFQIDDETLTENEQEGQSFPKTIDVSGEGWITVASFDNQDNQTSSPRTEVHLIDLPTALRLADAQNPLVAYARERIQQALALEESARFLWLPSLRVGSSWNAHEGTLQQTGGGVFDVSRTSFYAGGGSRAIGAGSPAYPGVYSNFSLSDAIFEPLVARGRSMSSQAASLATTNDVLLKVALGYLELLRAIAEMAIALETRNNAQQLADLTASYSRSGQGLQADADRAQTELAVRQNDVHRAVEAARVASARLAQLLRLDPMLTLKPVEDQVVPIHLVSQKTLVSDLVAQGLEARPELAEAQQLVTQAVYLLKREECAPLLPSVVLSFSYGGFGGGPSGTITNTTGRMDAEAVMYWELRNFGLGERAARRSRQSAVFQAQHREISLMDRVAREVIQAHIGVVSRSRMITIAQGAVRTAANSFERNLSRIKGAQGLPIEVMQSIQALAGARREYLRTVIDYNSAQFTLHHALGWPVDVLTEVDLPTNDAP